MPEEASSVRCAALRASVSNSAISSEPIRLATISATDATTRRIGQRAVQAVDRHVEATPGR